MRPRSRRFARVRVCTAVVLVALASSLVLACTIKVEAPAGSLGNVVLEDDAGANDSGSTTVVESDGAVVTVTTSDDGAVTDDAGAPTLASLLQHNLDTLNGYRIDAGVGPLVLDPTLTAFAQAGSQELSQDHTPHQHFEDAEAAGTLFTTAGFTTNAEENQGDPAGDDIATFGVTEAGCIDSILAQMMAEGPGGGHHDSIVDPKATRLGAGLVVVSGALYFTNDFSPP